MTEKGGDSLSHPTHIFCFCLEGLGASSPYLLRAWLSFQGRFPMWSNSLQQGLRGCWKASHPSRVTLGLQRLPSGFSVLAGLRQRRQGLTFHNPSHILHNSLPTWALKSFTCSPALVTPHSLWGNAQVSQVEIIYLRLGLGLTRPRHEPSPNPWSSNWDHRPAFRTQWSPGSYSLVAEGIQWETKW